MKKSWSRSLKLILLIGLPLGIVLSIVQNVLHIDRDLFLKYYAVIGVLVVLASIGFNLIFNLSMQKKIQKISIQMLDGENVDENIEKLQLIYKKCYSHICKSMICINLSVAHSDKGDYHKALQTLEKSNVDKLPPTLKVVFYVDQAYFNYMLGNYEKANQISDENQKLLGRFKEHKLLKFSFKINDAYRYFALGEKEKAEKALGEAEQLCSSKREEREHQLASKNIL